MPFFFLKIFFFFSLIPLGTYCYLKSEPSLADSVRTGSKRVLFYFLTLAHRSCTSFRAFFGNCDRNTRGVKKHDIKKKGRSVLKTCRSDVKGTRVDKQVRYLRIGAVNCTEMQRGMKLVWFDVN